jgi:hypothetical protein
MIDPETFSALVHSLQMAAPIATRLRQQAALSHEDATTLADAIDRAGRAVQTLKGKLTQHHAEVAALKTLYDEAFDTVLDVVYQCREMMAAAVISVFGEKGGA